MGKYKIVRDTELDGLEKKINALAETYKVAGDIKMNRLPQLYYILMEEK